MTLNIASGMGLFSLEQLEERSALGSQRMSTWPPSEQEMLLWENPITCAGVPVAILENTDRQECFTVYRKSLDP